MSDLSEFHRIDLVAVLRDFSVSPRMILARLAWLPDSSATHASLRGEPRGWGDDRHLAATAVDAIQANTWATVAVASKRKPRKPRPLKRPKAAKPQLTVVSAKAFGRSPDNQPGGR